MTFALDTNTVIYFFKGRGRVAETLLGIPPTQVAIPSVVVHEVETGIAKSAEPGKRREQLQALLDAGRVLPFGREEAFRAAGLRAALEREGRPIGPLDTLIAGTALAHDAVLVTHNTAEFTRVPGLRVTDWF